MLHEGLKDSDIPHCSSLRAHILQMWDEYLDNLLSELKGSMGCISFTTDLWTDLNLCPFMAITCHWIENKIVDGQAMLHLRSDLIGFHRVPGRHSGEHLAEVFIYILDRLHITSRLGWITCDNATNNDMIMDHLELLLQQRYPDMNFERVDNRIRCFPHIVNLACHDVERAIDRMKYGPDARGALVHVTGNPIDTLRTLIKAASRLMFFHGKGTKAFAEKVAQENISPLQLLRDVDVRWSSTDIMIERALLLRQPILMFLQCREQRDLQKHQLSDNEWTVLQLIHEILSVPHAFQQRLSAEKTPTLCDALPSFSAFILRWRSLQEKMPEMKNVIQAGLEKLEDYFLKVMHIPAYNFAMILNPKMKLRWYEHHEPHKLEWAKNLFMLGLA
ncbi:uncharacterized protein ARMOST_02670 [Armillaria ostoyae]|uniref:AC transposase n=1 Tax=Armillaria ostoyae TaxID=47428 RepID=A0A284QSC2_ARMOS|nr:uncharacterized protein ARMOST_02670 [Armillaria ostoyae]